MKVWWCIFGIIPVLEAFVTTGAPDYCPKMCFCDAVISSCQNSNLSELPEGINPNVMSLDISLNVFEHVPVALKDFRSLRYLNLSYNFISTLSHSDFAGLINLEVIDLSFNRFHDWKDINANALTKLGKLTFLDISNNLLGSMPQHSNYFPTASLNILKMNNCSFKTFPVDRFNNIIYLKELHLTDNPVTILDYSFTLKNLKYIDLSNCQLEHIEENVFTNLTGLETLVIRNNQLLRKFTCNSDSLLYLDLSKSYIQNIPVGNMRALQSLYLEGSIIKRLLAGSLSNFPNLLILNLSMNAITEIDETTFLGLNNLKVMDLSFNKLRSIPEKTLLPIISLEDLNLSHNYINSLDSITSASLRRLDLSYCEIYDVNKYSLSSLMKLQKLSLSRNPISSLPDDWSANSLIILNLSGCRIRSITNNTFQQMYYLRNIDLSDNLLSYVEPSFFPVQLRSVNLDDNNWMCNCAKLKPMYEYLTSKNLRMDYLVCDAPEKVQGFTWYTACGKEWKPAGKKENLYWYSIAFIISISSLLLILAVLRKLNSIKEKRYREMEERRRQQERDAREALARMRRLQREYMEEDSRNAPDPRESQGPPSYNDALLLPTVDSSHTSLHGSVHSLASRGSLHGSSLDINKKGKRRRRRRRSESLERIRRSRNDINDSDTTDLEVVNRAPLESDF